MMNTEILYLDYDTPAFVYDEECLVRSVSAIAAAAGKSNCRLLYALKSFTSAEVLQVLVAHVDGFATSSLYEARLARDLIGAQGTIHITTPGFRPEEIGTIAETCDYIAFNSLSQWERFGGIALGRSRCGLRVNPQLPLVKDDRYNPCRPQSKLGVPLEHLKAIAERTPPRLAGISGLHVHSNCDASDFNGLLATVRRLDGRLSELLRKMRWINLGGGYLFDEAVSLTPFYEAVELLRSKYHLQVFIEPGASIVRKAGYLVSTVLDIFESEGKTIAILDTTVNHMPEVFEYQFEPDILGSEEDGRFAYILAGCTCLAGDLFGEYTFPEPLEVGSRVVFANVGAYTLVKAHMFNGINLPTMYALTKEGGLVMKKRFTYEDFASRCGVKTGAAT